ncbi:MAG: EpsI family protein [Candidatus Omnitrophica bacterium]|nr:EpsI family protein [Candidatus Omnitrophota bacterium]
MRVNKNTLGYAAIIALLVATSILSLNLFLREKTAHDKLDISTFPYKVMNWQGRDLPITEKEYAILETRNLISREYTNPAGEKIYLFIIYSETNRAVFHPPEVCLIGSGITIADKVPEEVKFDKRAFLTNKLFLENGPRKDIALYCYRAGDLYTDNFYLQQGYLAIHQIFGRLIPGATIRLTMASNGDEKATLPTMKNFLKEAIGILDTLSKDV